MRRLDYMIMFIFMFIIGFIIESYINQLMYLFNSIKLYYPMTISLWFTPTKLIYILVSALFILLIARFRKPEAIEKTPPKIRLRRNKFLKGYALDYDEDGLEWLKKNLGD